MKRIFHNLECYERNNGHHLLVGKNKLLNCLFRRIKSKFLFPFELNLIKLFVRLVCHS